jgi:hypothetical protein
MIFKFPYGVAATVWIPVTKAGSDDAAGSGDFTPASGDAKALRNDGTTTSLASLTTLPAWDNGSLKVVVTATEMQTKYIHVRIVDQDAAKVVADTGFIILTTGNANAMYPYEGVDPVAAFLDAAAGVETGLTPRQFFRLAAAVLFGKSSGGGKTFRNYGDTKDRVTATVDGSKNRTAVTYDAS